MLLSQSLFFSPKGLVYIHIHTYICLDLYGMYFAGGQGAACVREGSTLTPGFRVSVLAFRV